MLTTEAAEGLLKCFGNGKVMAVSESKQTVIIYSPTLERSHYFPNKMVYNWFEAS